MKILIASPEAIPYVKTGGLADVAGSLCKEYRNMNNEAHIVLPLFKKIKGNRFQINDTEIKIKVPVGDRFIEGRIMTDPALNYFIECDEFFDREELYGTSRGDFADNASRFIFFSRGILEMCRALGFQPDIIHCNDWQTGLVPLYLKTIYKNDDFFRHTATLLTIHNLGYQGLFPASEMPLTNLGWEIFNPEGIEFYGKVNFLKAGIISADILTTVSETYSRQILQKEYGFNLEGLLQTRKKDLYGVINGIDYDEWDPEKDSYLPSQYTYSNISGKNICKKELMKSLFKIYTENDFKRPLIGMVGRLSEQKGLDIFIQAIPELMSFDINLVILGKGDESYELGLYEIAKKYKKDISFTIGFDDSLAHRIYAGSDFFLMPSKYEPCGLGQLISLRYGSIPIARKTGGLADTIQDYNPLTMQGTGFLFSDYTHSALLDSVKRALCVYTDDFKLKKMITDCMKMDFSWKESARKYIELYKRASKQ